ncbi:MAG: carbonic anhydrase family protein [Kofleriaceae bacterium]
MLTSCEMWKAPDRVHELEARVDELSAEVSAIKGKPVGGGPSKTIAAGLGAADPGHGKHDDDKAEAPALLAAPPHGAPAGKEDLAALVKDRIKKEAVKPKESPHWGYGDKAGPATWATLDPEWSACGTGKQQSPIDISPQAGTASAIEFHYKPTAATVVDNGHTIQVGFAAGSSIEIDKHSYELVQFHVHTPSEHAIAGERYPLEVHLVHKDKEGKLAVIGVLYDAGVESKSLDAVWTKWPKQEGLEEKLKKPFDPSTLLPSTRTVFRYDGSLTTPPCSEGVVWSVMRRTMTDSQSHLAVLASHYKVNARPVQALGDRKVK